MTIGFYRVSVFLESVPQRDGRRSLESYEANPCIVSAKAAFGFVGGSVPPTTRTEQREDPGLELIPPHISTRRWHRSRFTA